jgi:hypothetical protein
MKFTKNVSTKKARKGFCFFLICSLLKIKSKNKVSGDNTDRKFDEKVMK